VLLTTVFVLKAIQCHLNTDNYSSSINLRLDILQVVLKYVDWNIERDSLLRHWMAQCGNLFGGTSNVPWL
jgi:hypothetical protein